MVGLAEIVVCAHHLPKSSRNHQQWQAAQQVAQSDGLPLGFWSMLCAARWKAGARSRATRVSQTLKKEGIWKTRSHAVTVEKRYRMIR